MSQTLKFIYNHPLMQLLTRKKEGKLALQKFKYLENEKRFLDKIKSIFHDYLRAIIRWKHEK